MACNVDLTAPYDQLDGRRDAVPLAQANVVASHVVGTHFHAPVLDIDLPCRLLPSSTLGHYHLFIDKLLTWERYQDPLAALGAAGILEEGYVNASLYRGGTYVRKPGLRK